MNKTLAALAILAGLSSLVAPAQAHRAWILPAATVLSSEDPWVTFDAAISNDIFHPDYHALGLEGVEVAGPNSEAVALQNPHTGKYRSTFDLALARAGTYKVYRASNGPTATWTENGERRRWPGRGASPAPGDFEREVPMDAQDLKITQSSWRIETFVTAGQPNETALAPGNIGLELVPVTHPNDLYVGEPASFRLLIDGEPAAGAKVSVLAAGMRYRDSQLAIELTADEAGLVVIDWPRAGMYFLEADYADDRARAPATARRGAYAATFEVLPL
ncbi:DUF4198 domain-containing protein [Parahaliea mediterranea]|uniref:DUF4198 domain-containing protein n=1 Tax=Parahaliea mediterranea TaxID=651086 RepID=A0A939INI0_9GAMM|nr:DUF4198 domain-containing protein [Parahaliea mediterranea]MBN7798077.1 DUF4198 domain-containing protein [Parahaliea mediterranea]